MIMNSDGDKDDHDDNFMINNAIVQIVLFNRSFNCNDCHHHHHHHYHYDILGANNNSEPSTPSLMTIQDIQVCTTCYVAD